ncbi:uncharacterized protein LOC131284803 [Anopheles ziemanni]|uniref:uncharacterized protein LOC131260589 n=1 Tax=Anopheles coustani TaxID=139045 RepID=UPI00265B41F0|nr:uncharacterized protein LOC131260589 [Anopheles coustani]XP_058169644.1 uncharacterized protein LOC131284803 [Anopheles ziemanni]
MASSKPVTIPEWMTNEFFRDAVAKKFDVPETALTVDELDVRPATESGDNFVSVMYRVRVTVRLTSTVEPTKQHRTASLIVKALPSMGLSEEMIMSMNVFPKETAMYTEMLPAFERLYRERGVEVAFGPRCLKHCTDPTDIIVMEDLQDRDFRMANRRDGLDLEHCQTLLRRLAQFHAASAVLHEKNGPFDDKFKDGMYAEKNRKMFEQFQEMHDVFMYETMCNWPGKGKFYAELMRHWGMDMFDALLRIAKPDPNKFNVLNHGDMWCNNMMFQYTDDKKIREITLVDFQMSMWCSPVIDLNYFLFSSVRADLKLRELDYLISYYHRHLSDSLTLLGFGGVRPTLQELHSDFIDRQLYGLSTAFSILPICLMEKTEDASIDLMLDQGDAGTAFKKKMYNNPTFVEQMGVLMEHFHDTGAFDITGLGVQRPAEIECVGKLDLPLWLDRRFFEDVVQSKLGACAANERTIRGVRLELATKKGDNYASVLYRARVEVQNRRTGVIENFSTVVKAPPKGALAQHMSYLQYSVREVQMYKLYLPAFEQLYRERGVEVHFGPRCFKVCEKLPADVLVLDDLTYEDGSRMADRRAGLDQSHTELALELLAQYHAASAVYVEQGNTLSEEFVAPKVIENMDRMGKELFQPMLDNLIGYMAEWDWAAEYHADLQALAKDVFSVLVKIISPREGRFCVLNHGDLWVNNMLFSYGTGSNANRATGVTLVDFQMCCWASPVIDLHSFLFTSVCPELRLAKLNYFVRYYQEKLVDNLLLLGYRRPLPTLQQLHVDFNDALLYGLTIVLVGLPFLLVPDAVDASHDTDIGSNTEAGQRFQKLLLDNDDLREQLKMLLPFFRNRGILHHKST